jgi:hypothetical protein
MPQVNQTTMPPAYDMVESPAGEQRWLRHRHLFVPPPPAERFDPSQASVELIPESTAKAFVLEHHYSHSFPAARLRVGLFLKASPYQAEQLAGVAVFAVPMQPRAIPAYWPSLAPAQGVELSRFVLLPMALFNAETWFLAKSFRLLHRQLPGVRALLSYADPIPRISMDGTLVKRGHLGGIYRSHNARSMGRSSPRTLILAPDGRVISDRALSKLRTGDQGAAYAYRQLQELGAPPRNPMEDDAAYVRRAIAQGPFRKMRHPGNLAFGWDIG